MKAPYLYVNIFEFKLKWFKTLISKKFIWKNRCLDRSKWNFQKLLIKATFDQNTFSPKRDKKILVR